MEPGVKKWPPLVRAGVLAVSVVLSWAAVYGLVRAVFH